MKTPLECIDLALTKDACDDAILNTRHNGHTLKEMMDIVIDAYTSKKLKSLVKAIVSSSAAKKCYPEWDTRNHQTQIGGQYSLRTICDKISQHLHMKGLYDAASAYALTRSFEKAEPYTQSYSGQFKNAKYKTVFLNIVELLNTTKAPASLCETILVYLLLGLKKAKADNNKMCVANLDTLSDAVSLQHVKLLGDFIGTLGGGSSKIPVLFVYSCLQICTPLLWPTAALEPLQSHTAADCHTGGIGDIMVRLPDASLVLAIEMKHKIKITPDIIHTFAEKCSKVSKVRMMVCITTSVIPENVQGNVLVKTMSSYVVQMLQSLFFFKETACSDFIQTFQKNLLSDTTVSRDLKLSITTHLTSLLASSSP